MRLTVNLSLFFHDHRSLVKIFVHKDMKRICDVEEHLTKIFNINNFYFKCENQYLPPCESVHVLKTDDTIWAVPFDNAIGVNGNEDSGISEIKLDTLTKEKKKKKQKREVNNDKETVDSPKENISEKHEAPITKPKKKKRSHHCKDENMDEMKVEPNETFVEVEVETNESSKLSTPNTHNSTYNFEMQECSLSPIESTETAGGNKRHVKSLVNTFEKKVNNFYNPISEDRKINIVKTIIVSKFEDQSKNSFNQTEASTQNTELASNSLKNNGLSDSESVDSSIYFSNLNDTNVTKRKRKRVRTRKPKPFYVEEIQTPFEQSTYLVNKSAVHVQTPNHIRFEDSPVEKNDVDLKLEELQEKKVFNSIGNEIIVINDSVSATPKEEINVLEKNDTKEEKSKSDKELESCILKQPVTSVVTPKVDDVIAFKILRISENYTPEVSSTIIGKVISYDSATNQVKFYVTYGRDQCVMPQGKFFLELENNVDNKPNGDSQEFQFAWTNLLEPRLLFP